MFAKWVQAFDEYRASRIADLLSRFIDPQDTVLDCGCGRMMVTRSVGDRIGTEITGVDVINLNHTDLGLCIYDGRKLPFADNSFDITYLAFVLHHTPNPRQVLRECLRVTRRWVIVLEDVYGNKLELALLKILDWIGNRPFSSAMSLPYKFKTAREWIAVFQDLGANVVSYRSIRPLPWRPTRHRMFVVEQIRQIESLMLARYPHRCGSPNDYYNNAIDRSIGQSDGLTGVCNDDERAATSLVLGSTVGMKGAVGKGGSNEQ